MGEVYAKIEDEYAMKISDYETFVFEGHHGVTISREFYEQLKRDEAPEEASEDVSEDVSAVNDETTTAVVFDDVETFEDAGDFGHVIAKVPDVDSAPEDKTAPVEDQKPEVLKSELTGRRRQRSAS